MSIERCHTDDRDITILFFISTLLLSLYLYYTLKTTKQLGTRYNRPDKTRWWLRYKTLSQKTTENGMLIDGHIDKKKNEECGRLIGERKRWSDKVGSNPEAFLPQPSRWWYCDLVEGRTLGMSRIPRQTVHGSFRRASSSHWTSLSSNRMS